MINEWNENNLEVVNYKSKYNIICFNINNVLMIITQTNCAGTYYNIVSNNYRIKFDNIVAFISTCDDEPVQKNCWCYYASYDHEGNVRDSASLIFSETDLEGDHLKQIYKNDLKQHGFTDQEITDIENATSKCSKKNGYLQCITMQDRENFPNCCLNCTCHPNDSTKDKQDIGKSIICEGKSPKESGW